LYVRNADSHLSLVTQDIILTKCRTQIHKKRKRNLPKQIERKCAQQPKKIKPLLKTQIRQRSAFHSGKLNQMHLQDKDKTQLQKGINQTLRKLHKIAKELNEDGHFRAGEFIANNARFRVTFAELALEGINIPYATNRIERLIGEVSKRCKHKWIHWSTRGLKDILTIVLVRYTNKSLYGNFKKAYIHNEIIH